MQEVRSGAKVEGPEAHAARAELEALGERLRGDEVVVAALQLVDVLERRVAQLDVPRIPYPRESRQRRRAPQAFALTTPGEDAILRHETDAKVVATPGRERPTRPRNTARPAACRVTAVRPSLQARVERPPAAWRVGARECMVGDPVT